MGLRCLIVDDNEAFLASATRLLSSQGLDVVGRAANGQEALRLTETLAPDVVLVDVLLGGENGLEVTRQLAARTSARVILISTHTEEDLADLIADSPAVAFLPKAALGAGAIAELLA